MTSRLVKSLRATASWLVGTQAAKDLEDGRLRRIEASVHRIERDHRAILRHLHLDGTLPFPQALLAKRFGVGSQNEEDGITLAFFNLIDPGGRRFVDLGAGNNGGNSGFLARECGWEGLMVEANADRTVRLRERFGMSQVKVVTDWITRENINDLLADHHITGEFDLLSIDIDGSDYWVWDSLRVGSPRLVIVEFNPAFGPSRAVVVPYDPLFDRTRFSTKTRACYYGASLAALARLAAGKGYRLVLVEPRGVNAYFLRNDVHPEIPGCEAESAYALSTAAGLAAKRCGEDPFATFDREGLPLVDVPEVAPRESLS